MKKKIYIILVAFATTLISCNDDPIALKSFPTTPVNLEVINTANNEYNEAIGGFLADDISFIMSTDENSNDDSLDLKNIYLSFQNYSGIISFYVDNDGYPYFDSALVKINTSNKESDAYVTYNFDHSSDVFVFTSNQEGNSDIFYSTGNYDLESWSEPVSLEKINTNYNETNFIGCNNSVIYTSNESGNYDIYKIDVDDTQTFKEWVESDESIEKENFEILNSDFDDICPQVNIDYIIFASNREGGYGGYDLYYSYFENNQWNTPVNFGAEINTEFDEINPVSIYYIDYNNDLMFFSSNRTGGKGGFDIYYVGIPNLIN